MGIHRSKAKGLSSTSPSGMTGTTSEQCLPISPQISGPESFQSPHEVHENQCIILPLSTSTACHPSGRANAFPVPHTGLSSGWIRSNHFSLPKVEPLMAPGFWPLYATVRWPGWTIVLMQHGSSHVVTKAWSCPAT